LFSCQVKESIDDRSAHVLTRYTGLGFINIGLVLQSSVRQKIFPSFETQIFLRVPSIPNYQVEASKRYSLPNY
jgi:hypothetical protein